jgi:hypothetical protein
LPTIVGLLFDPVDISKNTVTALFTFYRRSAKFTALKPRVKEGYEEAITYLLDRIGDMSFKEITPGFVAQLRDKVQSKRSWHWHAVQIHTGKTGEYAEVPIPRPLISILKECTAHNAITLCANSR